MFCLRSWLPLLFIPTNASPLFVISFFLLTYILNRPCVYCSILLLILLASSCYWSDHPVFDLSSDWFEPRHRANTSISKQPSTAHDAAASALPSDGSFIFDVASDTVAALGGAALEEINRRAQTRLGWSGAASLGSWLASRTWRVPCLDVTLRL